VPGRKKIADFPTAAKGEKRGAFRTPLAFSPDGKALARGTADGAVELWEAAAGKKADSRAAHKGAVASLCFSPDGKRLASGGADRTVRVWDVAGGKEVVRFPGHAGPVIALAFAPDGAALVAAAGGVDAEGKHDYAGPLFLWELPAARTPEK
jgi:WD40 repeat protein